mmetsp:Transcript_42924/g.50351  ORF Transcript_42924/g.50351 Transcript_42924/m.50351 type:complete len:205 (-) Transcript_42924:8-622(-)
MCIDNDKTSLYTGDNSGFINCFDLGAVGKERFTKQITEMSGISKIRYLCWGNQNKEVFAGNQTGKVTVWNAVRGQSIYVHEAHEKAITKMQWFEKSRYLITASKEKFLHIWEMPKEWIKEDLVPEEETKLTPQDEEKILRKQTFRKLIEQTHKLEEEKVEEVVKFQKTDKSDAFKNMQAGFDPLGGAKFKPTDFTQDDLSGWHK